MSKNIVFETAAIAAFGFALLSNTLTAHGQQSGDTEIVDPLPPPSYSLVQGANIPVRSNDEAAFTSETQSIPVETYRDEALGTLLMVTDSGAIAAIKQPEQFKVTVLGSEEELIVARFMPRNGLTWVLEDMEWVPVTEPQANTVQLGDYTVHMVETEGIVWYVRSDSMTGRTWILGREDTGAPPVWLYAADPDFDDVEP